MKGLPRVEREAKTSSSRVDTGNRAESASTTNPKTQFKGTRKLKCIKNSSYLDFSVD